ncbi:hypothetical protein B1992_07185 [Pseudoxanthomonas broegbernensis]|uniref:Lectin n=1 Tax=Pseudoxanthomonas broegbernensis TaxID=83619 RepID=A0A7V8GMU5_9GAMM|nr:hypothetical protein [Pseudoxanthomonas broegbernensis]KAF1686683.1 hypothetical protein B1992_07185 [Pseudoxanthomonas broegbernensis]MBB6063557.1 hypothetical protein [Pseudoxanthomonas broegbernensis]
MPLRLPDAATPGVALFLALFLAACTQPPPAAGRSDAQADDPFMDQPAEAVPPATAPGAAAALAPPTADFSGLGPVPFGAEAEALRRAWDGPLEGAPDPADAAACHYLFPPPRSGQGYGTAFMVEGGRFVRVDVDDRAVIAPGGGRIGMQAEDIALLYAGRIEERPHKYVEGGRYLRIAGEGSDAVLVFETDAQGTVQAWRIGLPPQVDYVEGCS